MLTRSRTYLSECHVVAGRRRNPGKGDNIIVMEVAVRVHVERLPEGVYLVTSEDLPGLVAQGRTAAEALEIARDVAKKLIEARLEREGGTTLPAIDGSLDATIVVGA